MWLAEKPPLIPRVPLTPREILYIVGVITDPWSRLRWTIFDKDIPAGRAHREIWIHGPIFWRKNEDTQPRCLWAILPEYASKSELEEILNVTIAELVNMIGFQYAGYCGDGTDVVGRVFSATTGATPQNAG